MPSRRAVVAPPLLPTALGSGVTATHQPFSFIVDKYDCGSLLGTLNVTGTIAQIYRGPVGIVGQDGYVENYNYDDNLRAEEPPHFLEPIQAAWHVVRETECNRGTTVC